MSADARGERKCSSGGRAAAPARPRRKEAARTASPAPSPRPPGRPPPSPRWGPLRAGDVVSTGALVPAGPGGVRGRQLGTRNNTGRVRRSPAEARRRYPSPPPSRRSRPSATARSPHPSPPARPGPAPAPTSASSPGPLRRRSRRSAERPAAGRPSSSPGGASADHPRHGALPRLCARHRGDHGVRRGDGRPRTGARTGLPLKQQAHDKVAGDDRLRALPPARASSADAMKVSTFLEGERVVNLVARGLAEHLVRTGAAA